VPSFPDPDEQEGPEDWTPRLWGDPQPPQPEQHGFVAGTKLGSADRALSGFAFVERYRDSRCALLSYIAVAPGARARGVGRTLFARALESAREAAEADQSPLVAVFAEIHDPARVAGGDDVIDPAARVRIMARLGAWRVPVTYVQPALDETSARSDRLMLVAFPLNGNPAVTGGVLLAFLHEFYCALGVDDPTCDPDLAVVERELRALGVGPDDLMPLLAL
jgi:GNAT superfamily N-acetyltransferase